MITQPGIYDLPEHVYHADPCPTASLSHSIAKVLLTRSPLHAKVKHPRLSKQPERTAPTSAMIRGTLLHKLLLGKGADIEVCNFADWRKKEAQEMKAAAIAAGRTPTLVDDYNDVQACAKVALEQMRQHPDIAGFFEEGQSEAVIAWEESGIWCRGMADRLPADRRWPMYDLKLTGTNAEPGEFSNRYAREYATQDAFYRRGLEKIRGVMPPPTLFVVIEDELPYAVSVVTSAPSLEAYAMAEMDRAIHKWSECMRTGQWPSYAPVTAYIECPAWMSMRQEERAIRDEITQEFHKESAL